MRATARARRNDGRCVSHPSDTTGRSSTHVAVALMSFFVAIGLLLVKFWVYSRTESQAIFSDALESIVNVAAALVALSVLKYAGRPADRYHPYGRGKVEFFSAAFEGGLIFCAALVILWQAAEAFSVGAMPRELDFGLLMTFLAG
ncbi:MAG: cation diffusion facilitator family transporter, partial [Planctomycetota bacterium]